MLVSDDWAGAIYRISYKAHRTTTPDALRGAGPATRDRIFRTIDELEDRSISRRALVSSFRRSDARRGRCRGLAKRGPRFPPLAAVTRAIPEMPNVPAIAGEIDNYLQWQPVYFCEGRRKNELMSPIAQDLADKDVRNLGAYFASLPKPSAPTNDLADASLIDAGKKAVADHRCAACHTDTFQGAAGAPAITHQHHDYLIKALTDYREHARPSTGVGAMNDAAASLTYDDIKAISAYLETYK